MKIIEPTKELMALNAALKFVIKKNIHHIPERIAYSNKRIEEDRQLAIKKQKVMGKF